MKIDRLVAIISLLLERDTVSTSELAEKLEVSRRTIFRDVDTLSMAGLPVMTTRGSVGGVSLMKSYKVDKKLFTPQDVSRLIAGLESYHQLLENRDLANTLVKLQSMKGENGTEPSKGGDARFSVDLAQTRGNRSLRGLLQQIETAINEYRCLLFRYTDRNGEGTLRQVEPYKIVFKEGSWYLQAFCLERNDYRIFKLARMSEAKLSDEAFSPKDFEPLHMGISDGVLQSLVPVTIRIDLSVKDKIIERFGEDHILAQEGSEVIARYPIVDNEHGYNVLLRFGKKCEILEPAEVRQHFIQYLDEVREMYR
ncbi:helix-turn-helix transcriptional regulator [Gorillibacterium massiliense]|uniref:helix-turn-helix transcriptional regulator n=1 Tax=Gorillibacterium massiliense TaxID=1280390 RepID=UPI0004BB42C8|nr:YafY family protein [Gorillibacterium massiliense]